jgi:hypothetical protein
MTNLIPGVAASEELAVLEQAAYQTAMYLSLDKLEITGNNSLNDIISTAYDNYDTLTPDEQESLNTLKDICDNHPEFGEAVCGNQSWNDRDKYDPTGIQACTFTRAGQLNVCYRGTPKGAWVDNAMAMSGDLDADYLSSYKGVTVSPMQLKAIQYMEEIIADGN